jgi:soluble lytic murein transglycosylase-like protein
MFVWRSDTIRYIALLVLAVCSLQYALLAEMRKEPRPLLSRVDLDLEASQSFSVLVDLIADSRVGLHGSFSLSDIEPIEAPRLDVVNGVASTMVFAEDEYLNHLIDYYADYYQVDPLLITLIMEQESGYDPFALSPAGAMGLMQLMPDTAWMLGVSDPWDPEENIEGGVRYFAQQMDRFGRLELALAAYNAGPGSVEKWGGVPPYPETLDYVNNIMGRYRAETESESKTEDDHEDTYEEYPEFQNQLD